MLTINEYQQFCVTRACGDDADLTSFANFSLGLIGEFGEVCDILKKVIGQRHDLEEKKPKLVLELGDCFWYVAMMSYIMNKPLNDVLKKHETFRNFQPIVKTENNPDLLDMSAYMLKTAAGIARAVIHVADKIEERSLEQIDFDVLTAELYSFSCRLCTIITSFGLDIEDVIQRNVDKLTKRFKDGFTVEESLKRIDDSKQEKIYLVMRNTVVDEVGSWSDPIFAYKDKDSATLHAKYGTDRADELMQFPWSVRKNGFDPELFGHNADYRVEELLISADVDLNKMISEVENEKRKNGTKI